MSTNALSQSCVIWRPLGVPVPHPAGLCQGDGVADHHERQRRA